MRVDICKWIKWELQLSWNIIILYIVFSLTIIYHSNDMSKHIHLSLVSLYKLWVVFCGNCINVLHRIYIYNNRYVFHFSRNWRIFNTGFLFSEHLEEFIVSIFYYIWYHLHLSTTISLQQLTSLDKIMNIWHLKYNQKYNPG